MDNQMVRRFRGSREMSTDQHHHVAMRPETEFRLSVLLLAAGTVPIHSVAMSLIRSMGIVSMLYVPAVVIVAWIVVWRCRAGLQERPPIGLLITLPLATAELAVVAVCLGLVALVHTLGWESGDSRWPSMDTYLLPI